MNAFISPTNLGNIPQDRRVRMDEAYATDMLRQLGYRADAQESAAFLRQLAYVQSGSFDVRYADLKARTLFPVNTDAPNGALSYIWNQFDGTAQGRVVNDYGKDFPNADAIAKQYESRIISLGSSYRFSLQDLRSAQMAQLNLEQGKAKWARRGIEQLLEQIAFTGFSVTNAPANVAPTGSDIQPLYGIANQPGVAVTTVTHTWATDTVANVMADLNLVQQTMFNNSLGSMVPDTLILPTIPYGALATTQRSVTFTEDSILQYILKQSPWLKSIEFSPFLDLAGRNRANSAAGPRAVLYKRDPEFTNLVISQDFETLPAEREGAQWKFLCHMRTGGVVCHYPLSMSYIDGMVY